MAMPATSPMAHPVRQCSVALMATPVRAVPEVGICVMLVGVRFHATHRSIPPGVLSTCAQVTSVITPAATKDAAHRWSEFTHDLRRILTPSLS